MLLNYFDTKLQECLPLVRFYTGPFFFLFLLKLVQCLVLTHYLPCFFFPAQAFKRILVIPSMEAIISGYVSQW